MGRVDRVAFLVCSLLAAPAFAGADIAAEVGGRLRLGAVAGSGDEAALEALSVDPAVSAGARGRAFYALFARRAPPLSPADRIKLQAALGDPSPEMRQAALRVLGKMGERALETEALKHVAEDAAPQVRIEALRAVRPWSRQSHLFYLEQALMYPSPRVQAEALRSLGAMPLRELPPEILEGTEGSIEPGRPAQVRLRALEALKAWGKLDWPRLKDLLLGDGTPEILSLFAIEASDRLAPGSEVAPVLLEVLSGDPSQRLALEAFRRLRKGGVDEAEFQRRVVKWLTFSNRKNTATDEMVAYLRTKGYRADYRTGAWKISSP